MSLLGSDSWPQKLDAFHTEIRFLITNSAGPYVPQPKHVGVSENSVPNDPMVLLIIIPMKNGYFIEFHWEY